MYTKKNTRVTFRSNRRPNFKRNNNFSNSKPRNKGNVTQQYNKYLKMAKEAFSSGDRIQSEYYYQFTDHYYRLMVELGINLEENTEQEKSDDNFQEPISASEDNNIDSDNDNDNDNDNEEKKNEEIRLPKTPQDLKDKDLESIESIPFISKPPKKKTRTRKASV